MKNQKKKIKLVRIIYTDPDATDSSSDDLETEHKATKRKKHELVVEDKKQLLNGELGSPFQKKSLRLGTFISPQEDFEAYGLSCENANDGYKNVFDQKNLWDDTEESRFGYLNGVQIVDSHGFLVGEFSKIDDLTVHLTEDGLFV